MHEATGEPPLNAKGCKPANSTQWVILGDGYKCTPPYICQEGLPNHNYGMTSFDNFPGAMVTLFQVITLYNWSFYMFALQQVYARLQLACHFS